MADPPEIQALQNQLEQYYAKEKAILDRVKEHGRYIDDLRQRVGRLGFAVQAAAGGPNYMGITPEEKATWKDKVPALKQAITHRKHKLDVDFPNISAPLTHEPTAAKQPTATKK